MRSRRPPAGRWRRPSPPIRSSVGRASELVEANDAALLATVLDDVLALTMAPRRSRLERLLIACRMPEPTARLVAATPALRWAWIAAVGVVLLFAAGAAE